MRVLAMMNRFARTTPWRQRALNPCAFDVGSCASAHRAHDAETVSIPSHVRYSFAQLLDLSEPKGKISGRTRSRMAFALL